MKLARVLFLTVLSAPMSAWATAPFPGIFGTGQWKDWLYAVSPASSHAVAVKWNPEKEDCPLSVPRALRIARESLKKMVGAEADLFRCDEVKLAESNGYWFYVVRFYSEHPTVARKGEVGIFPAILPFIVYLDGVPEAPFKKMPNKAPEPTTTSVTPPANER